MEEAGRSPLKRQTFVLFYLFLALLLLHHGARPELEKLLCIGGTKNWVLRVSPFSPLFHPQFALFSWKNKTLARH